MEKEKFNQNEYIREWKKKNMKQVKVTYKTEFVEEFKAACEALGIAQSDVFREAMQKVIDRNRGV